MIKRKEQQIREMFRESSQARIRQQQAVSKKICHIILLSINIFTYSLAPFSYLGSS